MTDDQEKPAAPPASPPSDLAAQASRLRAVMDRRHKAHVRESRTTSALGPGYAMAMRLSAEFVSGVIAGGAIGWGIDWLLGTSPWGLIIFLLLGFVAGITNMMRIAGKNTTPPPSQ